MLEYIGVSHVDVMFASVREGVLHGVRAHTCTYVCIDTQVHVHTQTQTRTHRHGYTQTQT